MTGSILIITGATRGIGRAAARAAGERGHAAVLAGRDARALDEVADEVRAAGGRAAVVAGDIADGAVREALVACALEAFGGVDALVNNAGVIEPIGPVADLDPEDWSRHLAVNVVAPAALAALALPHLRSRRGRIVQVSSGAAVGTVLGWAAYSAGKAALNRLNAILAAEEPDVTCVALSPGMTETAMQATIRDRGPGRMPAASLARFVEAHERGEMRTPEEVGAAIVALASGAPSDLSGEFVTLDDPRVRALMG